jgi:hypothetical protein
VRKRPGIARFLAARLVYQDGLNAIVALGAGYAASLFHWSINEIGLFGMITNVSAILSCLIAARLDARLGSKAIVLGSLVLLLIASFGIVSTGTHHLLFGLVPISYPEAKGLFSTAAEDAFLVYGLMIVPLWDRCRRPPVRGLRAVSGRRNRAAISASMRWQAARQAFSDRFWSRRSPLSVAARHWACRCCCCFSPWGSF